MEKWLSKSFKKHFTPAKFLIMHRKAPCQKLHVILVRQVKHSFMRVFLPWELLGLLEHTLQSWMSILWFIPHPPWDFKSHANQNSPAGTVMQINNSLLFYDSPWFSQWDISKQQIAKAILHSVISLHFLGELQHLQLGIAHPRIWAGLHMKLPVFYFLYY